MVDCMKKKERKDQKEKKRKEQKKNCFQVLSAFVQIPTCSFLLLYFDLIGW